MFEIRIRKFISGNRVIMPKRSFPCPKESQKGEWYQVKVMIHRKGKSYHIKKEMSGVRNDGG